MTALLPTTATANVENASDIVEVVGAVLTDINCRPGAQVAIAGVSYFVEEKIDTTHFRLTRDFAGADATGVPIEIGVFTPEMANRAELAKQLREYSARLQLMNSRGHGLFYTTLGPTGAADPGPGKISYVGASWAASTTLCIDVLDAGDVDSSALIDQWALGDILLVQSIATGGYVAFALSEAPTNEGPDGWRKVTEYSYIGSGGALVDDEDVRLVLWRAGTPGAGFVTDEEAETQDDLTPWDTEAAGFTVFVLDMGGVDAGRAAVMRREGAAGNWVVVAWYTGPRGLQGYKGWSPQLSAASDGARRVLRLVGYVGGEGTAPTANIGEYLKADGTFTATIGDAVDFRGDAGPPGANGGGFKGAQVRVVTTANVDLASGGIAAGTTHDGVTLDTGDLVLCIGQSSGAENGVYPAPASGAATRHADFDTWADFPGAYFSATEGTARADTLWRCTSNKGGTLGTTALTFEKFSSGGSVGRPQGRLTLSSGTPVLTADVTAATTVYYTPFEGEQAPIYNGSAFEMKTFAELSLALDSDTGHTGYHQSGKNFDLFVVNDAGTIRLVSGPAWSSDAARGTGAGTTELERKNGIWTNKVSMTARFGSASGNTITVASNQGTYVGTLRASANGQSQVKFGGIAVGGSEAWIGLWNAYNRKSWRAYVSDSTDSWSYTTATIRPMNNSTTMRISAVGGLAEDVISSVCQVHYTTSGGAPRFGIGLDSTITIADGIKGTATASYPPAAHFYDGIAGLGFHYLQAVERGNTGVTFYGDAGDGPTLQSGIRAMGWF